MSNVKHTSTQNLESSRYFTDAMLREEVMKCYYMIELNPMRPYRVNSLDLCCKNDQVIGIQ